MSRKRTSREMGYYGPSLEDVTVGALGMAAIALIALTVVLAFACAG